MAPYSANIQQDIGPEGYTDSGTDQHEPQTHGEDRLFGDSGS